MLKAPRIKLNPIALFVIFITLLLSGCATEQNMWEKAININTIDAYEVFLLEYPDGEYFEEAEMLIQELTWVKAEKESLIERYEDYLEGYPEGIYVKEAKARIEELIWLNAEYSEIKEGLLLRTNPQKYLVTNSVIIKNPNYYLTKMSVIMPLPESNKYQDIEIVDYGSGEVLNYLNTEGKYLRFIILDDELPRPGETIEISYSFEATLYDIAVDFDLIKEEQSYNKTSKDYLFHTGSVGKYISTDNDELNAIAEIIWEESTGVLDYVKKCYEYVAKHYTYRDALTGINELEQLLKRGGGDCGNLSSIFISLLRYKDIPAKHLVAFRPNGSYHVWADFFLEGYGWVPVDVTYKNANPYSNYFGKVRIYDNGIIVSEDLLHTVEFEPNFESEYVLMQTWLNWFWWASGSGDFDFKQVIKSMAIN